MSDQVERDPTRDAFDREVASEEFWDAVEARRSAATPEDSLRVAAEYRRERAERSARLLRVPDETPEQAVLQVIANSRLAGAADPTPAEHEQLLAVARGEMRADEAIATYIEDLTIGERTRERDASDDGTRHTLGNVADELGIDLDDLA